MTKTERCPATHIQAIPLDRLNSESDVLLYLNVPHAGTIAHRCTKTKAHEGQCLCLCGRQWMRFHEQP